MQLFLIGLFELNVDGSRTLDVSGQPIPTYDNNDIREFAKVFTGFSFGGENTIFGGNAIDFRSPMTMFENNHEPGIKNLLNGLVVPDGQTGLQDVNGGQVFGAYPELAANSPLDVGRGDYAPTTSVDQYFAELALWFGVASSDLDQILPGVRTFYSPESGVAPLGFLQV